DDVFGVEAAGAPALDERDGAGIRSFRQLREPCALPLGKGIEGLVARVRNDAILPPRLGAASRRNDELIVVGHRHAVDAGPFTGQVERERPALARRLERDVILDRLAEVLDAAAAHPRTGPRPRPAPAVE